MTSEIADFTYMGGTVLLRAEHRTNRPMCIATMSGVCVVAFVDQHPNIGLAMSFVISRCLETYRRQS